ncbi:MAG: N-6 DNA methylase, partial [Hungatella sp.]
LQSAGNAGEFYTPRAVTRFMIDRVDPKLGESIMDPACGTGGFLACLFDDLLCLMQRIFFFLLSLYLCLANRFYYLLRHPKSPPNLLFSNYFY